MGSLAHCMKRNGLSDADQKAIRAAASALREEGHTAQEASVLAVQDRLGELTAQREAVMSQLEKPAGKIAGHRAQESTRAFKTWFGDSVVTTNKHAGGVPLVLYHGTRATSDFSIFRTHETEAGSHFGPLNQADSFVAPSDESDPKIIERGRIMPVYLKIENPLRLEDHGTFDFEEVARQLFERGDTISEEEYSNLINPSWVAGDFSAQMRSSTTQLQDLIKSLGYDGIVYLNRREGIGGKSGVDVSRMQDLSFQDINDMSDKAFKRRFPDASDSYIVFDETQVKSAIGNNGEFNPLNGKITAHRASPHPASWNAPDITSPKWEKLIFELQDKHVDTKKVIAAINEARGTAVPEAQDAYLQEELYHGRAAKQSEDFQHRELKPLIQDMALRGVKLDEFETFLHNRHAKERNEQIARINLKMPDGGSGIKTADAVAYLAALPAAKRNAYTALARRVDAIIARTNQMLVSEGLEAQSTIDNWNRAYKNYVPLHREDMGDDGVGGTGQGYTVKGPASKRATGSTLPVENILANLALAREKTITRGAKNKVAQALVNLAIANPNKDFWSVDTPDKITFVGPAGLVVEAIDPLWKTRDNVVLARMPGPNGSVIERGVFFNKRNERAVRMASALKNLTTPEMGVVMGLFAKGTRYFSAINTQYNPIFGVVNIVRDAQQLMFNLTTTPIAGKQLTVAKNIIPALIGVIRDLRSDRKGRPARSAWAQTFEEFQKAGGQTGYRDMFVVAEERTKKIEAEIKQMQQGPLKTVPREFIKWAGGWLSDYNNAMENATRLAAFKVARDNGVTTNRAASMAKNLTVNFNRKGSMSSQIGALYAFFNASMQGTARLVETLKGPKGRMILAGGVLTGVLQAFALAMAGFDDDEPPEFVRQRSFIFPIGGKKYLTLPMPLGLNFLPNIGRVATELALSGGRDASDKMIDLGLLLFDTFSPVGGGSSAAQTAAPTLADPIVALLENKDWTGKPIERPDMNPLNPSPGHERAKEKASVWARAISEGINMMSGGTEYTPGRLSPTPDAVDYVLGQVTGGVGREISKAAATFEATTTGEDLPAHKIPLVGRFYGDATGQSKEGTAFYKNVIEINKHEREVKGREANDEDVEGYFAKNPTAELVKEGSKAEREVSKLRKQRRELVKSGASKSEVQEIELEITDAMKEFNDLVKEVRSQRAR